MKHKKPKPLSTASTKPLSDKGKLLYARFIGPAQLAISTMQQALGESQRIVVEHLAEWDGIDLSEGWALDVEKLTWIKMPPLPE